MTRAFCLFLALFCALVLWRRDQLTWPPYEDSACWLWMEANFLAESGFNYRALWLKEHDPALVTGGARAYMISVLPTLLAVLMQISSDNVIPLVAYHLFHLACGALLLVMMYDVLWRRVGRAAAAMVCLAAVTTPVFTVQLEMLGMDLPMATAAMAAAWLVWRQRYMGAAAASLVAFLFKATGALATMTTIAYLALRLIAFREPEDAGQRRACRRGLAANGAVLLLQVGLVLGSGMMTVDERWNPAAHTPIARLSSAPIWCPDVLVVLVITAAGSGLLAAAWCFRERAHVHARGLIARGSQLLRRAMLEGDVALYSWLMVAGNLAAITRVIFIPRYLTLPIPFLYLIIGVVFLATPSRRFVAAIALVGVTAFNLVNADGRYFPDLHERFGEEFAETSHLSPRASIALERSLEYRHDHRATIEALRRIETELSDRMILADSSYVVYLGHPNLGFVRSPVAASDLSNFPEALRRFLEATSAGPRPEGPVFVSGGHSSFAIPEPEPADTVYYRDPGRVPLAVYEKRWMPQWQCEAEREQWYLANFCPAGPLGRVQCAMQVAVERADRGELALATERLEAALRAPGADHEAMTFLAELLLRQRRYGAAVRQASAVLRRWPGDARSLGILVLAWLGESDELADVDEELGEIFRLLCDDQTDEATRRLKAVAGVQPSHKLVQLFASISALLSGDHEAAFEQLEPLLRAEPCEPIANHLAGQLALSQGRWASAEEHFHVATQGGPGRSAALVALGQLRERRGDAPAAEQIYRAAIEHDDRWADAHYRLGLLCLRTDRPLDAVHHLERAAALDPSHVEAANDLKVALQRAGTIDAESPPSDQDQRESKNAEQPRSSHLGAPGS